MGGVPIRVDASALQLRERSRLEKDVRVVRRALAVAMVLEGHSRTAAARSMGMERQALRDAIQRFNAEGWDGFYDRQRWPGLFRQIPALDKWITCRLSSRIAVAGLSWREGVARPE